jgi:hypothetical protein
MFSKLNNKIRNIIIITVTVSLLLSTVISFFYTRRLIYHNYYSLAVEYMDKKKSNVDIYLNLIEETIEYVASDPLLGNCLEKESYNDEVTPILDGLRNLNLNILGAIIYTPGEQTYSSSNISSIPPFEDVIQSEPYANLIDDPNNKGYWYIHHSVPNQYPYYDAKQMLSYICKVSDADNHMLGYMVVNTNIDAIKRVFNTDDIESFEILDFAILDDKGDFLVPTQNSIRYMHRIPSINTVSRNYQVLQRDRESIVLLTSLRPLDYWALVSVSSDIINTYLLYLIIFLIFMLTVFVILSFILANSLSNSIVTPLDDLHSKIESYRLDG